MNAGWYADPTGTNAQRYWDGVAWTNHVSGPQGQSVDAGISTQTPGPAAPSAAFAPPSPPSPNFAPQAQSGQLVVAPKNPAVSLLISFFIPGLGSMINGDTATGVVILIGWLVSWVLTFVLIGFFTGAAFWIWGMIDAYKGAQRWNLQHGVVS